MDEPTPWEDINPPMASAPRPAPPSTYSARQQPATRDDFRNELTACLALVVPVGMSEESRREWLAVAWDTLKHLPADHLSIGARKARELCDHPSKIVPTILRETEELRHWDRIAAKYDRPALPPPVDPDEEPCSPQEARAIMQEFGIPSLDAKPVTTNRAPLRKPTRADYIEMGVDPAALDSLSD